LNAHRLAVRQAEAFESHDLSAFRDLQFFGYVCVRLDDVLLEHFGRGVKTAAPHFVGEAGHLARPLRQLGFGDECAAPLFAPQHAGDGQLVQRLPHGRLAHAMGGGQLVFGRQPVVRLHLASPNLLQQQGLQLMIKRYRQVLA
jgi:hypothetical protein